MAPVSLPDCILPLAVSLSVPDLQHTCVKRCAVDKRAQHREDTSSSWVTPLLWHICEETLKGKRRCTTGQVPENNPQESLCILWESSRTSFPFLVGRCRIFISSNMRFKRNPPAVSPPHLNRIRELRKKRRFICLSSCLFPAPHFQHTSVNTAAGTFTKSLAASKFPYWIWIGCSLKMYDLTWGTTLVDEYRRFETLIYCFCILCRSSSQANRVKQQLSLYVADLSKRKWEFQHGEDCDVLWDLSTAMGTFTQKQNERPDSQISDMFIYILRLC